MSLAEQSQQWFPTSVQVTVHQARNLRIKGKNGTNDAYAIIQVAKDKFSTSVAEKSVAPVWKEEASFDLPLFHPSNAERCTLYIIVMHRANVGLDKFLGQAVINLLEVHDNKSRKKTDWFKLVDKTGKEDKARGEVLLDIYFMRNNLSASMFDLSMQDKPRSRISKLKDKVRGKRKDGFSDSASAIVPSVSQVLTDSEGEADAKSLSQSPEVKKKSKLKTLFAPKSNLQRNISQSMSTLGTLPEKNSSLSGSRSSGLNVDSPEAGKKKFKFLGHKRTGSSDSKVSQGPFSLLSRSKHSSSDLNNLCINGSHVYAEEAEPKSGSTLSLNSSGHGSVEDVRRHNSDVSADSLKGLSVPSYPCESTDKALLEQQRHQEEEKRRQAEEKHRAEAKRLEEEEKCRAEAKRLQEEEERKYQEEQDRKRRFLEDEARRKKLREEEEERRKREEECRMLEEAENLRLEEERHRLEEQQRQQEEAQRAEEQKRQEEASMSDRLSSLFGMIRKKEEKKEEVQQQSGAEELPKPAPRHVSKDVEVPNSHSTNPFEEIPLSSDPPKSTDENPLDHQKPIRNPQTPSAMVFLNRTAKVSAVKPRLAESLKPAPTDCQTHSQQCPSPATSESTLSSVPSESPDIFSKLHSSLAPPRVRLSSSESPPSSTENFSSVGESPTMSEQKRRAPLPPNYAAYGSHPGLSTQIESPFRSASAVGGNLVTIKEIENPGYVEADESHFKRPPLPLPDYETLFPQKRHGVLGETRWDHIIAEVNQRQRDCPPQFLGQEMSVDGPEEQATALRSSLTQERPAIHNHQTWRQEDKPISSKKVPAPTPPKPAAATHPRSEKDSNQKQSQNPTQTHSSVERPNPSAVLRSVNTDTSNREVQSVMPKDQVKKALQPPSAATDHKYMLPTQVPRTTSQKSWDTTPLSDQKEVLVTMSKETPTAKPRQKVGSKEPMNREDPDATLVVSAPELNSNNQTLPSLAANNMDKKIKEANERIAEFDPFPSAELLPKDPWAQLEQIEGVEDYLFTGKVQQEQKPEDQGMTPDDLDKLFTSDNPTDPFSSVYGSDSDRHPEHKKKNTDSDHQPSPVFQRKNSQRRKQLLLSLGHSDNKATKPRQELKPKQETTITTTNHGLSPKEAVTDSITSASVKQQPQVDEKTQRTIYGGEKVETQFREDPFGTGPFSVPSSSTVSPILTATEPLQVVMEESASQGGLSGGKAPLRAWVSPSDVQPVSAQNSNGGGLASMSRRPHPVKPMNSAESQHATSSPAVREIKAHDSTTGKTKQADSVESGPYTQLTQEELITLVVKQQVELSRKDAKIVELEEYIDNLLVRVIEEKPSILLALNSGKQT